MAKSKGRTKGGDTSDDGRDDAVGPFAVVAKKSMMRGGRAWTAGLHIFDTPEKIAELGTPEQVEDMLATLELYPDDFKVDRGAAYQGAQEQQPTDPAPPQT